MADEQGRGAVVVLPEGVRARLQTVAATLSDAELRVAQFVERNAAETVRLPVKVLADRVGVSEATIVRFCQSLGYRGLRELKLALAAEIAAPLVLAREDILPEDSVLTIARKLIQADIQMLVNTLEVLDAGALERAAAALLLAPRILFLGTGNSQSLAIDAQHRFAQIGLPAIAHTDPYGQTSAAALLPPQAVAFAISHSGSTPEIITALAAARDAQAVCVLLTSNANAPAAAYADVQLVTARHSAPLDRNESASSRMAHMAVVDALYAAVMHRRLEPSLAALARVREAFEARRART